MKVKSVIQQGEIISIALQSDRYEKQRQFIEDRTGVLMPEMHEIPFNNRQLFRVLMEPLNVHIYTDDGHHVFYLKQGMITDFASIPRALRGRFIMQVDNDDPRILIPSLVHDAGCSFHIFGDDRKAFTYNNRLFKAMCRYYGFNMWQSRLLYSGVQSPVGWCLYNNGRGYESYLRAEYERID